jgi:hypothetical protein
MTDADSRDRGTKKVSKAGSLAWAVGIALPMLGLGAASSMALAHSGGPLLIMFFWPVFPAFLLFGSRGPLNGAPEWLFIVVATFCQVLAVFLIVHGLRLWHAKRSDA